MATHSSIPACKIPWTEVPGRLQSMGSQRVRHNLVTKKQLDRTHAGVKKEKAMAPHSSALAWKIPWAEEPGRLQSMGLRRVGQD